MTFSIEDKTIVQADDQIFLLTKDYGISDIVLYTADGDFHIGSYDTSLLVYKILGKIVATTLMGVGAPVIDRRYMPFFVGLVVVSMDLKKNGDGEYMEVDNKLIPDKILVQATAEYPFIEKAEPTGFSNPVAG